jgi:hypothetical protein
MVVVETSQLWVRKICPPVAGKSTDITCHDHIQTRRWAIWMCLENALRVCEVFRVESALFVTLSIISRCLGKTKENILRQSLRALL